MSWIISWTPKLCNDSEGKMHACVLYVFQIISHIVLVPVNENTIR